MSEYLEILIDDEKCKVRIGSHFRTSIRKAVKEKCKRHVLFKIWLNDKLLSVMYPPRVIKHDQNIKIITYDYS